MRKFLSILLSASFVFSLAACSSGETSSTATSAGTSSKVVSETASVGSSTTSDTVILTTENGAGELVEVEFPKNPERIAVLDMAALDIIDSIGYGDKIVGVPKNSSIEYLQEYITDDSIANMGTVKEADIEALMQAEPDVIFIGGRLAASYDQIAKIAPVYMIYTDDELDLVQNTKMNAENIAALYDEQAQIDTLMADYDARITALQQVANGQDAIVGMVNAGGFSVLGNDGRCALIGTVIGFNNIGVDANIDTSAHGNEASFEFVLDKNPAYIFVMDRDAAIGTEGAQLAAQVMDNALVNKTTAAQNGNVIILEHSNVWYTAENGITALGIMLSDLEGPLLGTTVSSTATS